MKLPWSKKDEEKHPITTLQNRVNSLFDNFWKDFDDWGMAPFSGNLTKSNFNPKLEIKETEKDITFSVELPGMSEKDVEVTLDNNRLSIKGEKKVEEEKKEGEYHYTERSYGSFYRSLTLPENIVPDKVNATFKKGVLVISVPKDKEAEKSKKIAINKE